MLPQSPEPVARGDVLDNNQVRIEMLVFVEGGKPEYPEKNPRSSDENQQQTQPTYDAETGIEPGPHW